MTSPRNSKKAMFRGACAFLLLVGATVDGTIGNAGAEGGCGEYSFGFTDTRLINDGISNSAGPFPIDLPAGLYDVKMVGQDDHTTSPHSDQPGERWYVDLNNGWQSPLTEDLPDDADMMTTDLAAQTIPASTAISVHHAGEGNVNSIEVVCVGFTPVAAAEEGESGSDEASEGESDDAGAEAPTEEDTTEESVEDAAADDMAEEVTPDDVADESMVDEGTPEGDGAEEPAKDEVIEEPPADEVAEEPPADEVTEEPAADDAVEEPLAEEMTEGAGAPDEIAGAEVPESIEEPATDETVSEDAAEDAAVEAAEPAADVLAGPVGDEAPTAEPVLVEPAAELEGDDEVDPDLRALVQQLFALRLL